MNDELRGGISSLIYLLYGALSRVTVTLLELHS